MSAVCGHTPGNERRKGYGAATEAPNTQTRGPLWTVWTVYSSPREARVTTGCRSEASLPREVPHLKLTYRDIISYQLFDSCIHLLVFLFMFNPLPV